MNLREIASQPKKHSFLESIINVLIGFVINTTAQVLIYPLFDIHIPLHDNLLIAGIFTVISIVRSFGLRRAFNAYHLRGITAGQQIGSGSM